MRRDELRLGDRYRCVRRAGEWGTLVAYRPLRGMPARVHLLFAGEERPVIMNVRHLRERQEVR